MSITTFWLLNGLLRLGGWLARMWWRFVTGNHMDGEPRTNAGWTARGTQVLTKNGRAGKWAHRPRLERAGIRNGITLGALIALYGLVTAPTLTKLCLTAFAVLLGSWKGLAAYRWGKALQHNRKYVRPIAGSIGPVLGIPAATPAAQWLTVPEAFDDADNLKPIKVALSANALYDPATKKLVTTAIAEKTGHALSEFDSAWHMVGASPYLSMVLAPRPPAVVPLSEFAELLPRLSDSVLYLGTAARGKAFTFDLDTDTPHLALSCASGAGKSTVGGLVIAQGMHRGWQIIILDNRGDSQAWCKDLPGVTYCRTGKEIHDMLVSLREEAERRYAMRNSVPANQMDSVDVGPRILVVWEEQNLGMPIVQDHWNEVKPKGHKGKAPGVRGYEFISAAGRAIRIHMLSVAQLFNVISTGGNPMVRVNYGLRILGRADVQMWKMLAPECGPNFPRKNKHRGRMYAVMDGEATEIQTGLMTPDEMLEHATSGVTVTVPPQWIPSPEQGRETVTGEPVTPAGPRRYTLKEASEDEGAGIVPLSYAALRQRKSRSAEFPKGEMRGHLETWSAEQLTEWLGDSLIHQALSDDQD
jgi:hypothetical protein